MCGTDMSGGTWNPTLPEAGGGGRVDSPRRTRGRVGTPAATAATSGSPGGWRAGAGGTPGGMAASESRTWPDNPASYRHTYNKVQGEKLLVPFLSGWHNSILHMKLQQVAITKCISRMMVSFALIMDSISDVILPLQPYLRAIGKVLWCIMGSMMLAVFFLWMAVQWWGSHQVLNINWLAWLYSSWWSRHKIHE